ncbi:MAG: nucleoside deaminase [Methylococcaceae bacterium]
MNPDYFINLAIAQAKHVPAYPFGAVIVRRDDNAIMATGFNQGVINPSWHGEMVAINNCAQQHPKADWQHFDLYTTAEPCPMCQSAILWAGIGRVYYGTSIAYLQSHGWQQIDIRAEEVIARSPFRQCLLVGGILETQCNALFENAKLQASNGRYFS